jgi:hypothetical protein
MYTAASLEDIAEHFENMAEKAAHQADKAATKKARDLGNRESSTWIQAAKIIRQTTITVGATP